MSGAIPPIPVICYYDVDWAKFASSSPTNPLNFDMYQNYAGRFNVTG
jgi:hypothetical protein